MTHLHDIPPPRRLWRDRAANFALWCGGVLVVLAPGWFVTMMFLALSGAFECPDGVAR